MGKGFGATRDRNFHTTGPKHLTQVDWENANHRMSVIACLVQGVYYHRLDYKKGRKGDDAIGPPWWESFHFTLYRDLSDVSRVFGAVFELDYSSAISHGVKSLEKAPRFVVAFRGTQSLTDIAKDFLLSIELLGQDNRIKTAIEQVREVISVACRDSTNGNCDVYLAGHSLGASVATCIGMEMAKNGLFLETYLFNPPFLRLAPETLKHKSIKSMIKIIEKVIFKLTKDFMEVSHGGKMQGNLCKWVPNLYLNPDDYICKGFIPYFNKQELFDGIKPGLITRVKEGDHFYDLYARFKGTDPHCLYLIPSAKLIINKKTTFPEASTAFGRKLEELLKAHAIEQWWEPDLELEYEEHIYNDPSAEDVGERVEESERKEGR